MASSVPIAPSPQLCDYCHQKPKFSNHAYCSKTCAGLASTLCNHCHKKPKFQNFDYCGKNCAALANPGGKPRNAAVTSAQPAASGGKTYSKGNPNNQQQQGAPPFDPVQLAKLVAQHIPQVQALLAPNTGGATNPANPPGPSAQPLMNPFAGGTAAAQLAPLNNPFLNAQAQNPFANPQPQTASNGAVPLAASSNALPAAQPPPHASTQQAADNLECLIPGCGRPIHVDAKGVKASDYCSMRHREEAVTSGLVSPCILCLSYPQSDTDYFCSRACREESMNKELEYDDCSDSE